MENRGYFERTINKAIVRANYPTRQTLILIELVRSVGSSYLDYSAQSLLKNVYLCKSMIFLSKIFVYIAF